MNENKSSISNATTYQEMGEFWDGHELTDFWEQTRPVEFEVDLRMQTTYYAVDGVLSQRLVELARQRGVSADTLLNLLVQEKLQELLPTA